jgi:hypothetical protein
MRSLLDKDSARYGKARALIVEDRTQEQEDSDALVQGGVVTSAGTGSIDVDDEPMEV